MFTIKLQEINVLNSSNSTIELPSNVTSELMFLLENFSLTMDVLDSDLNVGWAEVRNSAILKRSLGLIWMDLLRMKDNFEFLIEDIDKIT